MTEQFTPRTVAVVALASLGLGFVTVFGGGMLALRSHRPEDTAPEAPPPTPPVARDDDGDAAPAGDDDASLPEEGVDGGAAAPEPVQAAGVTLSPSGVSRCFAGMAPLPIPGERCDRLPALDAHFASRAARVAACAPGAHGRLAFIMDLRFSTQHVTAWGGPASTIPNAGLVSLCVRRATAPLPLATTPHANDRYVVVVPIEW